MIFDIVVLVVLLVSALISLLRGLIREVLTIVGVVGGLAAAYFGGPLLEPFMRDWLGVEDGIEPERLFGVVPYDILAGSLSYSVLFIGVVILLSISSHFIAEAAKSIGLGAVDRTFGFIFGLARGVLLLGLLYLPLYLFLDNAVKEQYFGDSRTHFYISEISEMFSQFLPEDADEQLESGAQSIEDLQKGFDAFESLRNEEVSSDAPENAQDEQTNKDGYKPDIRQDMDQLFDDQAPDFNE